MLHHHAHSPTVRLFLALLATSFLASTLVGQDDGEEDYEGPFYERPASPGSTFTVRVINDLRDGLEYQDVRLEHPAVSIAMPNFGIWTRRSDPTTSISFVDRRVADIRWSLSMYRNPFIPDLSPEALKGYVEWMKTQFPEQIEILNEDTYLPSPFSNPNMPASAMPPPEVMQRRVLGIARGPSPLGEPYATVKYTLDVAQGPDAFVKMRLNEYILFHEGMLFIFRLEAPAQRFSGIVGGFETLLKNMSRADAVD